MFLANDLQTSSKGAKQARTLNPNDLGRALIIGHAPTFDVIKPGIPIRGNNPASLPVFKGK
jgi:hypothetical protein